MRAYQSITFRLIILIIVAILVGGRLEISPASASPTLGQEYAPEAAASPGGVTIIVTTTADDMVDNGNCTLREAIYAANKDQPRDKCPAGSGDDTIILGAGTYTLKIAGKGENNGQTGDLDLLSSLTISGAGAGRTIINGNNVDRVFHVLTTGGEVKIHNLTITGGFAPSDDDFHPSGGGILVQDGILNLTNVIVSGNKALRGGGIENVTLLRLNNVTIHNNMATERKGGGMLNLGELIASKVTFSSNQAVGTGGGINNNGNATLTNVTFSGNTSLTNGGGIFNENKMYILNTTINANSSGIGHVGAIMSVKNSIISGSSGSNCFANPASPIFSAGHNIDSGSTCNFKEKQSDQNNTQPLLGPLQNNGGATQTHALQAASPAIDRGDPDNQTCPSTDQRGSLRPADGKGSGSAICDIGAFEYGAEDAPQLFLPFLFRP